MPVDSNKPQAAARKPRKRVRKIGAESGAAALTPPQAQTAAETSQHDAAPAAELRSNRSARQPHVEKPMTVMLNGVLTPILPVSLREPAALDARASVRPAPPAIDNDWHWAGPPLAATFAFLATLGALLLGYWIGYTSVTGGEAALTVAEASEKTSSPQAQMTKAAAVIPPAKAPSASRAAAIDLKPAGESSQASSGLHLQVSALTSRSAASELQQKLEQRGFPVRVEAPKHDKYVRVYVGPVPDGSKLKVWASRLRQEGLDPFPKRL